MDVSDVRGASDATENVASTENKTGQDQDRTEVVLVTGLSGAGLGTAARVLEDLGWYVADNLPPELVTRMVEIGRDSLPSIRRLAVVMDVRSRFFAGDLSDVVEQLRSSAVQTSVLYLEASNEVLVRRFGHARRRHPLQDDAAEGTLSDDIAAERIRLAPVRDAADVVIDTSTFSVHQLHRKLEEFYSATTTAELQVTVQSFGFKHGVPIDADLVLDMRFLPNPHWIPELREHTGKDSDVSEFVLSQPGAREYLDTCHRLLELTMDGYRREGKHFMTVAVGCTGGKHRSVAMSEELGTRLQHTPGARVRVMHRDLGRE